MGTTGLVQATRRPNWNAPILVNNNECQTCNRTRGNGNNLCPATHWLGAMGRYVIPNRPNVNGVVNVPCDAATCDGCGQDFYNYFTNEDGNDEIVSANQAREAHQIGCIDRRRLTASSILRRLRQETETAL